MADHTWTVHRCSCQAWWAHGCSRVSQTLWRIALGGSFPSFLCWRSYQRAYNIWLSGLPNFAGWILDMKGTSYSWPRGVRMLTAKLYLSRVGLDKVRGYLGEGHWWVEESRNALEQNACILWMVFWETERRRFIVLDVREKEEYAGAHSRCRYIMWGTLRKGWLKFRQTSCGLCMLTGNRIRAWATHLARRGF